MANIILRSFPSALKRWQQVGADIKFLSPKLPHLVSITTPTTALNLPHVLLVSGLHLEETSGPLTLFQPKYFQPFFDQFHFTLIPVINQYGLQFSSRCNEKYLRRPPHGFDYNGYWDRQRHSSQPSEITILKKLIPCLHHATPFDLALSLHEDSVTPGRAYLWANNVSSSLVDRLYHHIPTRLLPFFNKISPRRNPYGGSIRHGIVVFNSPDHDSIENYLADQLNIPTLLIEGPFGLKLATRLDFQSSLISTALSALLK